MNIGEEEQEEYEFTVPVTTPAPAEPATPAREPVPAGAPG